jgi:preprotein translocase subunit SecG
MNRSRWIFAAVFVACLFALGVIIYGAKTTASMQEPPHSTPNELATKPPQ